MKSKFEYKNLKFERGITITNTMTGNTGIYNFSRRFTFSNEADYCSEFSQEDTSHRTDSYLTEYRL